nr:pyridoxal-phosphate dependent enzyme [Pseudomonadota bacterium]
EQMDHDLDAVVCGVGTGGTLTGHGRFFQKTAPHVEMVLADPQGSVLAPYLNTGKMIEPGSWLVEGIGEDFIPPNCDLSLAKAAYTIPDAEAFATAREVLRREGLLVGSSSGTLIAAALRYCREQTSPKRVVTFVCDSGNKYLSKMYNDYWMLDQGFLARRTYGDLRDLIARRAEERAIVAVGPDEPLTGAYRRMKLYDLSQLPVMENDRIMGIIDESDILMAVYGHEERFNAPVREAMTGRLEVLPPDAPLDALLPVFHRGRVAIIKDGEAFLGLITRIDLLNYLRLKLRDQP